MMFLGITIFMILVLSVRSLASGWHDLGHVIMNMTSEEPTDIIMPWRETNHCHRQAMDGIVYKDLAN